MGQSVYPYTERRYTIDSSVLRGKTFSAVLLRNISATCLQYSTAFSHLARLTGELAGVNVMIACTGKLKLGLFHAICHTHSACTDVQHASGCISARRVRVGGGGGGVITLRSNNVHYTLYLHKYGMFKACKTTLCEYIWIRHKPLSLLRTFLGFAPLTLILLTWRIWCTPNNASRWQMGFNLEFKGLRCMLKWNGGFKLWSCVRTYKNKQVWVNSGIARDQRSVVQWKNTCNCAQLPPFTFVAVTLHHP
jgi:hypothetical protein